jgi:hypothetical protein
MIRARKKKIGVESVDNNDRQRFEHWLMLGELLNIADSQDGSKPLFSGKDLKNWFHGFPFPDSTDINAQQNYRNALTRFRTDYCLPDSKRRVKGLTSCGGEFLLSVKQEQELLELIQSEFFDKDIKLSNIKFAMLLKDRFAGAPDHEFNKYNFTASWMDHFVIRHNAKGRMVFQTVDENTEIVDDRFLERVLTPLGLAGVLKLQNERGIVLFQTGVNATPGLPSYVIRCNDALKTASEKQHKKIKPPATTRCKKDVVGAICGGVVPVKTKRRSVKKQNQVFAPVVVESEEYGVSNLYSPFDVLVDLTPETMNAQQCDDAVLTNDSPPPTGISTQNVHIMELIMDDDEYCDTIMVNALFMSLSHHISSYYPLVTPSLLLGLIRAT